MKVTDYKLVRDIVPDRFEATIKTFLAQGWQPLGAPFAIGPRGDETHDQLYQAMVKYSDKTKIGA